MAERLHAAKAFDSARHQPLVRGLTSDTPAKQFEAACEPIVRDILTSYEGFTAVEKGPTFTGTPFDYFGFKDGEPYVIELKSSRHHYRLPEETQRHRMEQLLEAVPVLHIALLQVKVLEGVYRMLYDDEVIWLFSGRKAPMEPIVDWVRERLRSDRAKEQLKDSDG